MSNIYYYCPNHDRPIGGVKVIYQHVDLLNKNGFSASVIHKKEFFHKKRCNWFNNKTKVTRVRNLSKLDNSPNDFIVIPEAKISILSQFRGPATKIILNQNAYYTFRKRYPLEEYYNSAEALFVVSKDNQAYLGHAFPTKPIFHINNFIDHDLFYFTKQKKKQIAYMPRKSQADIRQVIELLKLRGILENYELVPIDGVGEEKVAEIMRDALIFLCFGKQEGFQLPPAEAMASGCIVIGYHGQGAKEFMLPQHCYPIENGNILDFAMSVEKVVKQYEKDTTPDDAMREQASKFILGNYSQTQQEAALLRAWTSIFEKQAKSTT